MGAPEVRASNLPPNYENLEADGRDEMKEVNRAKLATRQASLGRSRRSGKGIRLERRRSWISSSESDW